MPDSSGSMAPSVPAEQDWLAGSTPRVRAMYADLRERIFAFGTGVSERPHSCGLTFLWNGCPFAYAFPQGTRLRIVLNLKREELNDPDGVATCIANWRHEGQGDWLVNAGDGRDIERAVPLARQVFETAKNRR